MFGLSRIVRAVNADRIRISPRDGKLLWLERGACIMVDEDFYTIETRTQSDASPGAVIYRCRGMQDDVEIIASVAEDGSISAMLRQGENTRPLAVDDIDCFG